VTFGEGEIEILWDHGLMSSMGKTEELFLNKFPFHLSIISIASYLIAIVRMENILNCRITLLTYHDLWKNISETLSGVGSD
jgi:hypothetical protein